MSDGRARPDRLNWSPLRAPRSRRCVSPLVRVNSVAATLPSASIACAKETSAELTIVVPTLNEHANIQPLVERIAAALPSCRWEILFVDDGSTDGTPEEVRERALRDSRIRLLCREGRRGLASACIEGMAAASAPCLAVMDADLQHDEALLSRMLAVLREEREIEIVVGSRYTAGGDVAAWSCRRRLASWLATRFAQAALPCRLADPMSGFFMLRRELFLAAAPRLAGRGFKLLLDLLLSAPRPIAVRELPYAFRPRVAGISKLDTRVAWEFVRLLAEKRAKAWLG